MTVGGLGTDNNYSDKRSERKTVWKYNIKMLIKQQKKLCQKTCQAQQREFNFGVV